jgi:6-phosphogluconolactonase
MRRGRNILLHLTQSVASGKVPACQPGWLRPLHAHLLAGLAFLAQPHTLFGRHCFQENANSDREQQCRLTTRTVAAKAGASVRHRTTTERDFFYSRDLFYSIDVTFDAVCRSYSRKQLQYFHSVHFGKGKTLMPKLLTYKSAALLVALSLAAAVQSNAQNSSGAVFVMTNSNAGNEILQFVRDANGSLVSVGKTLTGGNGTGGTTDPLASQNSLLLTSDSRFLLAVNAASGTIASFAVVGAYLIPTDVQSSGGAFPNAIAQSGNLVYVLNASGNSNVIGFNMENGRLNRIPNATGYLTTGLSGGSSLTFSADGKVLLVSERTTGLIDSFPVNADGTLGAATLTSYPGIFDFTTSSTNGLLITVGGPTISSTSVADDAKLTAVDNIPIFSGACWVVATPKGFVYASTGGPGIINGYSLSKAGGLTAIGTGEAAHVSGATILDLAVSGDGHFLFSLNSGNGTIGAWTINQGTGVLTANAGAALPASNAGYNGIAAY